MLADTLRYYFQICCSACIWQLSRIAAEQASGNGVQGRLFSYVNERNAINSLLFVCMRISSTHCIITEVGNGH